MRIYVFLFLELAGSLPRARFFSGRCAKAKLCTVFTLENVQGTYSNESGGTFSFMVLAGGTFAMGGTFSIISKTTQTHI